MEAWTQPGLAGCGWYGAACWGEAGMGFLGAGAVSEHFCVCVSGERVALLCRMFCGGSGSRRGRAGDAEGDEGNGRHGSLRSRESGHFDLGGSGDFGAEAYAESALAAVGAGADLWFGCGLFTRGGVGAAFARVPPLHGRHSRRRE